MEQSEAELTARRGYDTMAKIYADHVAREMEVPSITRSALELFAHQVQEHGAGQVADVGCGPGHITAFLAERGLDIFGVDNSEALLDIARIAHPHLRFEIGQLASLPLETGSQAGVVAKHSVIHTPVDLVPAALDEFARVLAPGGLLFLSFFGAVERSAHGEAFDHVVTTAYQLDVETVATLLGEAGLSEEVRIIRQPRADERQLPHAILFARR